MRIMLKLQQLLRENTGKLAEMITREHGKTLPDAEGEVGRGLEEVEHVCSIANLQLGEYAENAAGGIDVYTLIKPQIGRAHVRTPVTNAHLVCRLLIVKKQTTFIYNTHY